MFTSQIRVINFRGFKDETDFEFNEGINVLIGPNNSGKSNIFMALSLLFDLNTSKKLNIDDFNKNTTIEELKKSPPKIQISALIKESENEGLYSDDLVTVSTWLTKLEKPYEARLTYEFYLPEKEYRMVPMRAQFVLHLEYSSGYETHIPFQDHTRPNL